MPCDYSKYPRNWKEIRKEILLRARNQCECAGECGLIHTKRQWEGRDCYVMVKADRCQEVNGNKPINFKGRQVILTVAHLNHKERDVRRKNLKAMCQRCHLRYDAPMKAARRRSKKDNVWVGSTS